MAVPVLTIEALYLFPQFEGQLHELFHFTVDVLLEKNAAVVIELLLTGHLGNFKKAEVIGIGLLERKNDVDEIPSQLRHVANSFAVGGNADHRLGGLYANVPNDSKLPDKMMQQVHRLFRFSNGHFFEGLWIIYARMATGHGIGFECY